jgi:hypothetical protein
MMSNTSSTEKTRGELGVVANGTYEIIYDMTREKWSFNTGDCLIEVTTWTDLTVY